MCNSYNDVMDAKIKELRDNYLDWVFRNSPPDTKVYEASEDHYRFESTFALGELNFYDLEMYVVELRITDTKTDETAFFLHFELNDLDYAKELYAEFLDTYEILRTKREVRILLSCTSAITTSFLAGKLNEAAKLLSLDYHFDATPFPTIHEKVFDYDMVLLAPQVAQEADKLSRTVENIPVLKIKPRHFATYDAPAILETVRREWQLHLSKRHRRTSAKSVEGIHNNANILALTIISFGRGTYSVKYRFFKNGEIVFDETMVKKKFNIRRDICDILDTAVYRFDKYDIIGISISGIVRDGCLDLPKEIEIDFNLQAFLEDRYKVPVIIKNNTNTAAYGFYARHREHYNNIAFLSQPVGHRFAGVGLVLNGQPYEGSHGVAGEVKFTLLHRFRHNDKGNSSLLPGETIANIEKYARSIIALNDPDIILIRSKILPDTDIVRMRLASYIPEEYLPVLKKVNDDDTAEYMLLGTMLFCAKALESET